MLALKIFLGLVCFSSAALARDTYFNSTAHALKVYGHSYYNPMTGEALGGQIDNERLPFGTPKINFRGLPCACVEQSCGCCAGLNISVINFDRRFCTNFTFDREDLSINLDVLMNEKEIFQTSLSARNPPPVCIPLPYIPVLNFCLRLYDLSLNNSKLNTCIDFETRLIQSPLLIMHFDCVHLGTGGISWSRPGDDNANNDTTTPTPQPEQPSSQQYSTDVFDKVDFESPDEVTPDGIALDVVSTLSPEEEDKIGQHRIP